MIIQHPTRTGWLIATPEIEQLVKAQHRLIMPDGEYHPLHFHEPDVTTLEQAQRYAIGEVNRQAEATRAKFITNTPGKVGEYTLKKGEVQRWVAAGRPAAPVPSEYPIAVAEAAEWGISTQIMLAIWEERAAAWEQASARIAAIERRALLAIDLSQTLERVAEVLAGLDGLWPEP